jgi:hypothetical protein
MGKNKYIETPERMWELFEEYIEDTKSKPRKKNDFAGKDAVEVIKLFEVPLTMEGFENFVAKKGIINDLGDYFSNKDKAYSKYSTICSRIKRTIRQDQIEGGMAGIYNPSITQRLNGLVDKTESKNELTGKDGEKFSITLNL